MKNHENHKEITKKKQRNQKEIKKWEYQKTKENHLSQLTKKKSFQHISFYSHRKIHNYMVFIWH